MSEEFWADSEYIWRGIDTSPGDGRYYIVFQNAQYGARWCRRHMAVGEVYEGPGHKVQFFNKRDCSVSDRNSGAAVNRMELVAKHTNRTWNGLTIPDVVALQTQTGETMFFARGFGLVAWQSAWGSSAICEMHEPGARPDNVREEIPCLKRS